MKMADLPGREFKLLWDKDEPAPGIVETREAVLAILRKHPNGVVIDDLAASVGLDTSSLGSHLARMSKANLIVAAGALPAKRRGQQPRIIWKLKGST